ncbi:MAG: chemotaxis protein CheD [Rhodocyclaceae bacterium]|jgi:chemotaxis protein CheD|nr:chemotaxis protein CheD [Rhodocyclaceae bacterium]
MTTATPPRTGKELERLALNINPGGWSVQNDRPISTLLGSCVAVCFYDPRLRLAGMNHFLLPSRTRSTLDDEDIVLNGDYAMEVLLNAMYAKGAQRGRLVAKAFGGGNIVSSIRMAIGDRNAEFAREWLEREGIPLVASDFGGPWSRKVILDPTSGDAFCRRTTINQPDVIALVKAESDYEKTLVVPKSAPSHEKKIELF